MSTVVATALLAAKKFWILDPLYTALGTVLAWFYAVIPSYGVSIILLTVTVSILRMPLVAKQVKSQQEMQRIQPELKRIQAKYKSDPQKRNEELMKLYKEHDVNPFAGCLPVVLQFPLFIVLYRIILNLAHQPPKHIPVGSNLYKDLVAAHGKLHDFGLDLAQRASQVKGTGKLPYLVLVLIVVGTSLFQTRQMTSRLPKEAQQNNQMAVMGKVMPLFMGLISFSIPAGVVLYFIVSNLWQIGQQAVLFRNQPVGGGVITTTVKGDDGGSPSGGDGKSGAGKGGGPAPKKPAKKGLFARLAEAASQVPADGAGKDGAGDAAGKPGSGRTGGAGAGRASGGRKDDGKGNGRAESKGSARGIGRRGLARGGTSGDSRSGNGKSSSGNGRVTPPKSSGRAQPKNQPGARGKSRDARRGK